MCWQLATDCVPLINYTYVILIQMYNLYKSTFTNINIYMYVIYVFSIRIGPINAEMHKLQVQETTNRACTWPERPGSQHLHASQVLVAILLDSHGLFLRPEVDMTAGGFVSCALIECFFGQMFLFLQPKRQVASSPFQFCLHIVRCTPWHCAEQLFVAKTKTLSFKFCYLFTSSLPIPISGWDMHAANTMFSQVGFSRQRETQQLDNHAQTTLPLNAFRFQLASLPLTKTSAGTRCPGVTMRRFAKPTVS